MTRLPIALPTGYRPSPDEARSIAQAARAAAEARAAVLWQARRQRWARRWEALAASIQEEPYVSPNPR